MISIYLLIAYVGIGANIMLLDWSYYDRDFSEEELVIATRIFGMFVWPIVIISGLYLAFIHPRYSLEDFKK